MCFERKKHLIPLSAFNDSLAVAWLALCAARAAAALLAPDLVHLLRRARP